MATHRQIALVLSLVVAIALLGGGRVARAQSPSGSPGGTSAPAGSVLASDDFSDPSKGILPKASQQPERTRVGYVDGEYRLAVVDPSYTGGASAQVPGVFSDITVDVDVRMLANANPSAGFVVRCRDTFVPPNAIVAYSLLVLPATGSFSLSRNVPRPGNDSVFTVDMLDPIQHPRGFTYHSDAIHQGTASNHVQLTCSGSTITASINGTQVASVQDSSYTSGQVDLGAIYGTGGENNSAGGVDVRLANLVIRSAAPAAAMAPPTAPADLQATALSATQIRLDWTNTATNADGIQVYDALTASLIKALPANAATYTLTVPPFGHYCAVVYASNSAGLSPPSNQACADTPQ